MSDYCDGSENKDHPLFSVHANGLQILLYYDDVELCNPLGSSRKKHKVGKKKVFLGLTVNITACALFQVFFTSLLEIYILSTAQNSKLVAICQNRYIKKYNLQSILVPIVKDLQKLVSLLFCVV